MLPGEPPSYDELVRKKEIKPPMRGAEFNLLNEINRGGVTEIPNNNKQLNMCFKPTKKRLEEKQATPSSRATKFLQIFPQYVDAKQQDMDELKKGNVIIDKT